MPGRPAREWDNASSACLINIRQFISGVEVLPLDHVRDVLAGRQLFGLFQAVATIAHINHKWNAEALGFQDDQGIQQFREALPSRDIVPAKIEILLSFSGHEFSNWRSIADDFDV